MSYHERVLPLLAPIREMLLPYYGRVDAIGYKSGSAHDAVTELDIAVEDYASKALRQVDSSIGFVGEEHGGDRTQERFWLMDPIDGTTHFIRGMPFCTSQFALIERGEVMFSVIYDFLNDTPYWAERGQGSFRGTESIHVSSRPITSAYCAWETHVDKPDNLQKFLRLRDKTILFKTVSSGYELVLVATGKIEARVHFDPHGKDYDFAPGSLLVSEAGGVVANIGSTTYDYRDGNFIAANAGVYRALTEGDDAIFPTA